MIHVFENSINERALYEKIKYNSEHIPRVGEILHFPHLGSFRVKDIAYRISDDSDSNEVMWVEVYVENINGE